MARVLLQVYSKHAFCAWVHLASRRSGDRELVMKSQLLTCFVMHFVAAAVLLAVAPAAIAAEPASVATSRALIPEMSAEEIVARLNRNNEQRTAALRAYDGKRSYLLTYRGFPSNREAGIEVAVHYQAPESKSFDVVSASGSKWLQSKVLSRLLESEREAARAENQRQTALTAANYSFTLLGSRPSPHGGCYRLGVEPRRENKFLYRGEICVNAEDFAVESIDAEPARNPSYWIKKTRIEHRYEKIGPFWLPVFNQSVSSIRLGGTATLSIAYSEYELR